jgi:hypothetical protein
MRFRRRRRGREAGSRVGSPGAFNCAGVRCGWDLAVGAAPRAGRTTGKTGPPELTGACPCLLPGPGGPASASAPGPPLPSGAVRSGRMPIPAARHAVATLTRRLLTACDPVARLGAGRRNEPRNPGTRSRGLARGSGQFDRVRVSATGEPGRGGVEGGLQGLPQRAGPGGGSPGDRPAAAARRARAGPGTVRIGQDDPAFPARLRALPHRGLRV